MTLTFTPYTLCIYLCISRHGYRVFFFLKGKCNNHDRDLILHLNALAAWMKRFKWTCIHTYTWSNNPWYPKTQGIHKLLCVPNSCTLFMWVDELNSLVHNHESCFTTVISWSCLAVIGSISSLWGALAPFSHETISHDHWYFTHTHWLILHWDDGMIVLSCGVHRDFL